MKRSDRENHPSFTRTLRRFIDDRNSEIVSFRVSKMNVEAFISASNQFNAVRVK